jgi:hypothetical protein
MYLSRKTYVKNWAHQPRESHHTITITGPYAETIRPERISYIEEEVAYWRKANAIHAWFVRNVQEGKDDCETYYVSRDQLEVLLDTVNAVLESLRVITGNSADADVAEQLLPTQPGFFFGDIGYDGWYVRQLEYTSEVLTRLLAEEEIGEFEYQSSW